MWSQLDCKGQYANAHYWLLEKTLEAVTGEPAAALLTREVLGPLGLHHTACEPVTGGYVRDGLQLKAAGPVPAWGLAGGAVSTPGDVLTWLDALLHGRLLPSTKLPPAPQTYGLGWWTSDAARRTRVHGGDVAGFTAAAALLPDCGWGVVVLTNLGAAAAPQRVVTRLVRAQLGDPTWSFGRGLDPRPVPALPPDTRWRHPWLGAVAVGPDGRALQLLGRVARVGPGGHLSWDDPVWNGYYDGIVTCKGDRLMLHLPVVYPEPMYLWQPRFAT